LKKDAEKISHLNLALRAIRSINRLLVREKDRDRLLQGISDILIKNRGYDKVWIVVFDNAGNVDAWAEAGIRGDCFPLIEKFKHGEPVDCAQQALRKNGTVLIHNPASTCIDCPIKKQHTGWGVMTTPLSHEATNYGLLSVSIPKELVSDGVERALVGEIAGDIAFGLYRIEREKEHEKADAALIDRVKKLSYLFSFTDIVSIPDVSLEEILQKAVDRLPAAMQYPDISCAQIKLRNIEFKTGNYRKTVWKLSNEIIVNKKPVGMMAVAYLEERPAADKGPFLKEEEKLIKAIAIRIGKTIERKQGRIDLEKSEKRFRDLVENVHTCIAIIQNNRVVYKNPEYIRIFGPDKDSFIVSDSKAEKTHESAVAKVQDSIKTVASGRARTVDTEFRFRSLEKHQAEIGMIWFHCRTSMIEYQGRNAILVNMMDVSRAKELEHLLKIQDKMSSLGRVAAGIAHEIRNPLSGINIYLKTIEKLYNKQENSEQVKRILSQMQSASNKIESIIKKVMDFSKPGAPSFFSIDINRPIEDAVNLAAVTLRKSRIQIAMDLTPNLPQCKADPQMIEQVILNLISNASEALKAINNDKKIAVSSFLKEDLICISVNDSGSGVPGKIMGTIFDPFYTTKKNSQGIGLSICHRIITDHNGSIDVSVSKLGGAEFMIKLPVDKDLRSKG